MIDLAGAIELIAEQVKKHDVARLREREDLRHPQLVAFENAPFNRPGVQKRRCNTRIEVGARAVANNRMARLLDGVGQHIGNRGFAIGSHHQDGAARHARRQIGD